MPYYREPQQAKLNREAWLQALVESLRPFFQESNYPLRKSVHVSVGFPSTRATSRRKRRVGECWSHAQSADGVGQIFISPLIGDSQEVAAILVHELIHDVVGCEHGHKAPFKRAMLALGLEGPAKEPRASEKLAEYLKTLIETIGPYPHSQLVFTGKEKKQSTRLIKCECNVPVDGEEGPQPCSYTARVTRKWLDVKPLECPIHNEIMSFEIPEELQEEGE